MKRLLLASLLFGLIPTANGSVYYIVNHGRINIEIRCEDGVAGHYVQHMDEEGDIQTLNLKGNGDEYFKYPELISEITERENGYLCSQRQLTKKEIKALDKRFKKLTWTD